MYRLAAIAIVLAGCDSNPDDVSFDSSSGVASGLSDCICSYDDGSQGDGMSVQITCSSGAAIGGVSFFIDPTMLLVDQPALLIFEPPDVPASYKAGGTGQMKSLGPETRPDDGKDQIIRSIDGLKFQWDEQDACDAANGCFADKYHLKAGSVSGGGGGCEDFWASVDQATS